MARSLENSTSEQTKGVDTIAKAVEVILEKVERIKGAMDEVKGGGEGIMNRIERIRDIARRNLELSRQLRKDAETLEGMWSLSLPFISSGQIETTFLL